MTGISDVALPTDAILNRALLLRVLPLFIHKMGAEMSVLPMNEGTQTAKFRRYTNLASNTSSLTEGSAPGGKTLAVTDVSATLAQYGDFAEVFDRLAGYSKESIFEVTGDLIADQAAQSFDEITRDVIYAGTVVDFAGSAVSRATVTAAQVIALGDITSSVQTLIDANARMFTPLGLATDQVGTLPVRPSYWGLCHSSQRATIKGFSGFTEMHKYPAGTPIMPGELGEVGNVRFIETTGGKIFAGSGDSAIDVYGTLIFGQGFHGITEPGPSGDTGGPPSPLALQFIAKPFDTGDKADPLNQKATSGWKGDFVSVILNNAFGVRIEAALV